jgi:hypothetical protein
LNLAKYGIGLDNFKGCVADELNKTNSNLQLLDKDGNRLTVRQFITEYEKEASLIPYFKRPRFRINYKNSFGYIAYIGENWREDYKKLWNRGEFRNFRNKDYSCYYCSNLQTNYKGYYQNHMILQHSDKPPYPNKADLERLGLKAQGKSWEV